jgi:hypothetical protein
MSKIRVSRFESPDTTNGGINIDSNGGIIVDGPSGASIKSLTDAATIAVDLSTGTNFSVTLGGSRTLGNPTGITTGQNGFIVVSQDGTGGRSLSYSSDWKFSQGIPPNLSSGPNDVDILSYYVRASNNIVADIILNV